MPGTGSRIPRSHHTPVLVLAGVAGAVALGFGLAVLTVLVGVFSEQQSCPTAAGSSAAGVAVGPPGSGRLVGATEYGGPGDPSSGVIGARGDNLLAHPDSYAELGGLTWQTATMMGGLSYMTPLRITWGDRSAIAYKRDFGLGGGPIDGLPRAIDLWWQLGARLGVPYENGMWSGPVRIERPPAAGAGNVLGQIPLAPVASEAADASACAPSGLDGVALTPGPRAQLLGDGRAAAPAAAPAAVKQMIAAGNQIVGKPYSLGGGHGMPLSEVAPTYDCSSSVDHLLYAARLLGAMETIPSGSLMAFGAPGLGRWVTLYANPDHVFMYVAGLRWDTHNAAGPGDGSGGIGWHPLVRSSAGFVARHPVGL